MKRLLQLGFILGLAGTLAMAHYYPRIEYQRFQSEASVVSNGGRVEQFMVRLPADRLGSPVISPAADPAQGAATRLDHFKLRDINGNIIGMVARHEIRREGSIETAWLLAIPSRGSIALTAPPVSESIDSRLARSGLGVGETLEQALAIDSLAPATSVATTGEFAEIDIELVETWELTGMDDNGQWLGTLRFNTTARRST